MLQSTSNDRNIPTSGEPAATPHIVIVEDDPGVRTLLARILRQSGYDVTGAGDGRELELVMSARQFDLVLLDIMLPGKSGLDICRAVREQSRVPIIMISARGQESDRVAGLDLGADDYIAKPFGRLEVLARVRAVLRRISDPRTPLAGAAAEQFEFAGWRYDARRCELISPRGAEVDLTTAEHDLLLALLRHPQRVVGRARLIEITRSRVSSPTDRSVDVLISRLRRKLGDGRESRSFIRTVRGVGYMLAINVDAR